MNNESIIRLSIIVPVYNVEEYLPKCLNSLLDQDLPPDEYEILIIDDESPDGSRAIAEGFEENHKNIRVISQENLGLGGARNTGINQARGHYLMFVDSDDYIEPNILRELVNIAENRNLDILRFGHIEEKEGEPLNVNQIQKDLKITQTYTGEEFIESRMKAACYAWVLLISADLFREHELYFMHHRYYEDTEWFPRVLLKVKRVADCNRLVYHYVQRKGSITKAVDVEKQRKIVEDKMLLITHLQNLQKQVESRGAKEWFDMMISHLVISIVSYAAANVPGLLPSLKLQLKNKENLFPLRTKKCSSGLRRNIQLANFNFPLYIYLKRFSILIRKLF